jgi:hypothetical protein
LVKQVSQEGPLFLRHAISGVLATVHGRSDEEEKVTARDPLDETGVEVDSGAQ